MNGNTYDVVIIGGGVIGSSIARALSKYECRTVLLEKEEDVCSGTSKANSAIVHAGYDAKTGSLKAKLNVKGNAMMGDLSKELDFDFKRNSSLVLCFAEEDLPALQALYERGVANGVPDISILTGDEVRKMEPNVSGEVVAALYAPTGGIVCPFGLTIALAENACDNGVEFVFNTKAEKVEKTTEGYRVITNNGVFETKYVVNAAGVYSDEIHNMVSEKKLHIVPRRGEYCLLDKEAGNHVSATVFQLPGKYGKGILVSPTIHGNLLVGRPRWIRKIRTEPTRPPRDWQRHVRRQPRVSTTFRSVRSSLPSPACVPMRTAMISSSVRRRTHRASLMQPESSLRDLQVPLQLLRELPDRFRINIISQRKTTSSQNVKMLSIWKTLL